MKIWSVLLCLFCSVAAGATLAAAQSNEFIDELLDQEQADFGKAVYLVQRSVKTFTK